MKLCVRGPPEEFGARLRLPPSKSYVHRALFVASLGSSASKLTQCGDKLADDILASVGALRAFGCKITQSRDEGGSLHIIPGQSKKRKIKVYAEGSGTTARFAIAYAALASKGSTVEISGDDSLSMRPMHAIFESLPQLGVECSYSKQNGRLPVIIKGGGIDGGDCTIDGSISSQFASSLLISCTRATRDSTIKFKDPKVLVSKPYIDATLAVLAFFGLKVEELPRSAGYIVRGNQTQKGRKFEVPGDMSAGAAIICATLAASGESELVGINAKFPQPDAEVISIARRLGSTITQSGNSIYVRGKLRSPRILDLNMKQSPDLVPAIAGLAAAKGFDITISNVRHLRYKESDRLSVLARELRKLGVRTIERRSSLQVDASVVSEPLRKPILMDPEKDHRMLMAFAIAGLSGRYGEIFVSDPDCVKKSYPNFVKDLQFLCHDKKTLRIVEASR